MKAVLGEEDEAKAIIMMMMRIYHDPHDHVMKDVDGDDDIWYNWYDDDETTRQNLQYMIGKIRKNKDGRRFDSRKKQRLL